MADSGKEKIFVFGASGHARVVIDIIEKQGLYEVVCLVDDNPALKGTQVYGYEVDGGKTDLMALRNRLSAGKGLVAIGSNAARCRVAEWLEEHGFTLVTAIHPSAQISRGVSFGKGTVVMAGSVVNSDAVIGDNVIINTGATVDHDCVVGKGVHIAPGVTLCGTVVIGNGTFVGAGATIIPNISVGFNVMVAAGATVVRDVPDNVLVVGTPARVVRAVMS